MLARVAGDLPVDQIGREDVLRVLTPIWTTRPERASRLRQRIRLVLGWCQAHNHIPGDNVAGEGIDGALPAVTAVKRHYRAPPYQEVAEALKIVEASRASMAAKLCFRFTVLTAVRGIEARNATWVEVDLDARLWVIPPERMKGAQEHRVPLNDASLEVLEQARAIEDGSGLVFPSPQRPGRPLSVQGPIFIEAARMLGTDPSRIVMAVAYGDQWTNMVQPFWTIPLLAIAGLPMRRIMGYTFVVFIVTFFTFGGGILLAGS